MDYSKVSSIVINFLRPDTTIQCMQSLLKYAKGIKIYCGDQDNDLNLKKFCKSAEITYVKLRKDCGIGVARNRLVELAIGNGCDYFMWGDNDFIYNENLRLDQALVILNNNKKIGVVGGSLIEKEKLVHYERYMYYDKKRRILTFVPLDKCYPETLHLNSKDVETFADDISYQLCDITFNFCVAKKTVWKNKKVRWNNKIKVRFEHSYWFLMLQQHSEWQVAYCQKFQAIHKKFRTPEYDVFRNRDGDSLIYSKALGLDVMFGIGEESYDFTILGQKSREAEVQVADIEVPEYINEIYLENFFAILKEHNIKIVILDKSCLSLVILKQFNVKALHLGIGVEVSKDQLKFIEETAAKMSILITLIKWNGTTKTYHWKQRDLNIPLPVVDYLEKTFGYKWKSGDVLGRQT